jgi:hypothetical protein
MNTTKAAVAKLKGTTGQLSSKTKTPQNTSVRKLASEKQTRPHAHFLNSGTQEQFTELLGKPF